MTRYILIVVVLVFHSTVEAQHGGGISVAGGVSTGAPFTFSVSYFQPFIGKQLYAVGGFNYFKRYVKVTDDIQNNSFSEVNQAFIGVRIGDYLFVVPKISYNWYGKYTSFGWGIMWGILGHPTKRISIGFAVGHDQIRFNSFAYIDGPIRFQSLLLIAAYRLDL
jgi:hypothetical protein